MTDDPTRPTGVPGSIGCAEDDLIARVALLLPDAGGPTAAAVTAARSRLAAAPVAAVHDRRLHLPGLGGLPGRDGSRPRRHPRLRLHVVNAALAVVAIAVTLAVVSGAVGSPPPAQAAARAKLLEAGASAGRAAPLTPRRDQFLYITTREAALHITGEVKGGQLIKAPDICTQQQWKPVDPTRMGGRTFKCLATPILGEGGQLRRIPPDGYFATHPTIMFPNWDYLQTLVGHPKELYDLLAQQSRADQLLNTPVPLSPDQLHARMLGWLGRLMGQGGPQLDSVLYEVAAMLPGVELLDGLVDIDGRTGTGVSVTYGTQSTDLIFDPATGEALGTRTVNSDVDRSHPGGTVEASTTTIRVVDSVGAER